MHDELRIHAPLPDVAWRGIAAVPPLEALYCTRRPDFDLVHEAVFRREAHQMWDRLVAAMRPMLAPKALVTVHIRKSTAQKLSSVLAFDPRSKTWAVAIRVGFDRDDAPVRSLFEAWGPRFYAALRFAMPATDNDVADILDGDPENVIVLRRLPREAHPEITDAWFAANLVG